MKKLFNQWIQNLVSGTHNHFACYLPKSTGLMSKIILKLFFVNIDIPRAQTKSIRDIEKQGIIILVNKYKSYFEYLFYHLRYQDEGILHPAIGFDYRFFLWQPVFRFFRIIISIADHFFKHFSLQRTSKNTTIWTITYARAVLPAAALILHVSLYFSKLERKIIVFR